MSEPSPFPEPIRALMVYDAQSQEAYRQWTAAAKLAWLEEINKLYWAARLSRWSQAGADSAVAN